MPKAKVERPRHDTLYKEISDGNGILRSRSKEKSGKKKQAENDDFINSKTSRKILQLAQQQQEEIEQEEGPNRLEESEDEEEDQSEWESDEEDYEEYDEFHQEIEEAELDPSEERLFQKYMPGYEQDDDDEPIPTIADKIMEKIREKEMQQQGNKQSAEQEGVMLPPKVIEVFTRVGELLSRYRSGKLPKAFKIIPSLKNWQQIIYVTEPEAWSPQAVYASTRMFISIFKPERAQLFIRMVLLDRFRDEIQNNKTLNYHLYRALKKALFKPAAFFKGFLFPLCESGTCTLREAVIVGSVLTKVSVPALHSAAALLKLADMDYSGPNSLFIKVLLDKRYALPYKVIDAVVYHFMRFRQNKQHLPVVWHQSLLVFAQRYKNDITDDQKDALLDVIKNQVHHSITPEIRRELLSGKPRDSDTKMELN